MPESDALEMRKFINETEKKIKKKLGKKQNFKLILL